MLIVGFLAACSQSIRSNVTRFHTLPQPSGEKIVIVPMNPANKGSLEFATYANMIGNELGRFGYTPANGEKADLVVELDYAIEEGPTTVRTTGSSAAFIHYGSPYGRYYNPWFPYRYPYYGYGYGYGYYPGAYYYGGFYDPFGYYPLGMTPSVRTYVNYNRSLKMVIRPNNDNSQNLYEGEVKSTGRNSNLHEVMPYMVQAFFVNFPGKSGSTETVSIELPND